MKPAFSQMISRGDPIRKLLGPDQISTPDLERIDAERRGAEIHQTLGDKRRDRSADATVGTGRRLAGRNAAHGAPVGADLVGPGKEAHDLDGLQTAGPGIDRECAHVSDHVGLERGRDPVRVKPHLRINDLGESLAATADVL